ncbi:MAG: alpha/beta hydrolase [Terriglobia bacterium]|nr:MAG: alpha/beta hydrolase [Terriglobia bacterium]
MPSEGRGILSPVRLPVPPLQQVFGSFEFIVQRREIGTGPAPCENPNVPATRSRIPELLHVSVNGLDLAVWDWPGEDPPVLFVHATSFHGRCWDEVIRHLPHRHCLAFEARGHGRSAKPDPPYHWRSLADDLFRTAELLNLTGAIGVGHSMGGFTVTAAAALRPGTFSALLLVDPTIRVPEAYGTKPLDASFIRRRREHWSSPGEMFEKLQRRAPFDRWERVVLEDYCKFGLLPNGAGFTLACPPAVEASIYECSKEAAADPSREISAVTVPVTVLRAGFPSPPLFAEDPSPVDPKLASRFLRGRDVFLPDHAHLIPMEAPELVAGHIAALR